ncbi:hypothetical protein AU468_03830 [Alkalispirochaeta sphaeroplastigenens]|uniref:Leucyl/phenylalanyl-tRNA--protein transferase n=1 Tax=Alkalispirochaeta sphaeroplastigenens TaxID=1187066 RepID=A0A2S4JX77_9SPIO|nr:GNAT family N-acetyltransferase [Alkalispirochaeta sphaeroplastigenens]POR04111.1 hypothetical protein AU468_03830 [Alkalispirochaeta sphaeroplastigenens]
MTPLFLLDREEFLPEVPRILDLEGGEFCLSSRMDAEMIAACCSRGYLPMAIRPGGRPLLLIKCHRQRMVLDFRDLHVSRSTRRRARREELFLSVDRDLPAIFRGIARQHRENWLIPVFQEALLELHRTPLKGVSLHGVALRTGDGQVVAGEVGYRCGSAYTSLSGFHDRPGAGSVQIASLARFLERQGFRFWDLGMAIDYKYQLGARPQERSVFLGRYEEAAREAPAPLPRGAWAADVLLEGKSPVLASDPSGVPRQVRSGATVPGEPGVPGEDRV